jgi:tetratricopeptide (TPR) repeat protein
MRTTLAVGLGAALALAITLAPDRAIASPWAIAAPPVSPAAEEPTLDDPLLEDLLGKMQSAGLLDTSETTLEAFEARLQDGQNRYVGGDALGSAVLLYELTQDPRWASFVELEQGSSALYHLGVALRTYGAENTARAALAQVLRRGPDDPYFTPALRRHVDIALDTKDPVRGLADLQASLTVDGRPIEPRGDDLDELDYLRARALHESGDLDAALSAYAEVGARSRFRTAALYMQGLIHADRGDFRRAEGAFCSVVGGPSQSMSVYYVDHRYFRVRDLAQLGLGRVAHEERRHGHAFYHYFQIPEDSEHLPQALFEAAWTMAEEGEYSVARGLVAELSERFPDAPQTIEARVLTATLELYDCDFRTAEKDFTRFIDDVAPVSDHLAEIVEDPDRVRALHEELAELREGGSAGDLGRRADSAAHRLLLSMLDADPKYARLSHRADVLRREAAFAGALQIELEVVLAKLEGRDTAAARDAAGDPLSALAKTEDLERGVTGLERQIRQAEAAGADPAVLAPERDEVARLRKGLRGLQARAGELLTNSPPIGSARTGKLADAIEADRVRIERLRLSALANAESVDGAAVIVAADRLRKLQRRLDDLMGEARMGRIDAVLGAKKKLEIEVRDMAAGRFPPELFGKLEIEGVVGEDEEFWPYEGEYWADEYEGYR